MKTFREVTAHLQGRRGGPQDVAVKTICADSRQIRPGGIFIAIKGLQVDGHRFIPDAVAGGAVGIVLQDRAWLDKIPPEVATLVVGDSRRAAAVIASKFWGYPSAELVLAGVTGTNGKTTVTYLVDSIFQAAGYTTGIVGTLGRTVAGQHWEADRTTPDALELQKLLRRMRDTGVTHAVMEVSSHALELDRTYDCKFDCAIFTNLTQDHLDFHASVEEYFQAKLRLFTEYAELARPKKELVGVVNLDDDAGQQIARQAHCRLVTYAIHNQADVSAQQIHVTSQGMRFLLRAYGRQAEVRMSLTGQFNVYNALAAAAWTAGLEQVKSVPGRMERVDRGQDFTVIVDYAHTPDALRNVLTTARQMGPRRLISVFGCGGDRDREKRPLMGGISVELADLTIITSDNPRSEDPLQIIGQIEAGAKGGHYLLQPDRRAAIKMAVEEARPGDIVVIAGKGHETYQQFADRTVEFDDRLVAAAAIDDRLSRNRPCS